MSTEKNGFLCNRRVAYRKMPDHGAYARLTAQMPAKNSFTSPPVRVSQIAHPAALHPHGETLAMDLAGIILSTSYYNAEASDCRPYRPTSHAQGLAPCGQSVRPVEGIAAVRNRQIQDLGWFWVCRWLW